MKARHFFGAYQILISIPLATFAEPYCDSLPANEARLVACNLLINSVSAGGVNFYLYAGGFTAYNYDEFDLNWVPSAPIIPRGRGAIISSSQARMVCFGDASSAPFLPLNFTGWALVSCQSNVVATFEAIVGHSPMNGTILSRFNAGPGRNPLNVGSPPDYSTYTYTNGAWSPAVPTVAVGEAVFVYQPTNFVYRPAILNSRIVAGNFAFDLETVYGRPVRIEYAAALPTNSWQELLTFLGDGHLRTIEDPSDVETQRFYRIQSTSP